MSTDDPWGLVGTEFEGGLQVESVVGVGGFGTVYRAHHSRFRAPVALKVLRFPQQISPAQRLELLQRFEQETVLLFRLSRLTLDVASCLAAGTFTTEEGIETPYIVQEWLHGVSLYDALKVDPSMPRTHGLQEVIEILEPAVEALSVAHEQGVVHRDITPSNLFLVERDQVRRAKLLDFGIAKILRDDLNVGGFKSTMTQGFRVLSVEYAAPEQWDEQLGPVSPKTDLFSLALVVVEMLTGVPALEGNGTHALMFSTMDPLNRPSPANKGFDVPDAIEAHFLSALAVKPDERCGSLKTWWSELTRMARDHSDWACRPPSASEFSTKHMPSTTETGVSAPEVPSFYQPRVELAIGFSREQRRRVGIGITGSLLAVAALLLGAALLSEQDHDRPMASVSSQRAPAALVDAKPSKEGSAVLNDRPDIRPGEPSHPQGKALATMPVPASEPGAMLSKSSPSPHTAAKKSNELPVAKPDGLAPTNESQSPTPLAETKLTDTDEQPVHTGELRLNSIPTSAILIDGRPIGSTPKSSIHLSPGPHNVVFVHPEHGKRRLLVLVEAGKSQTLSIKF